MRYGGERVRGKWVWWVAEVHSKASFKPVFRLLPPQWSNSLVSTCTCSLFAKRKPLLTTSTTLVFTL